MLLSKRLEAASCNIWVFDRNPPVESSTEDVRIGIEFFKETFDRGYLCTANTPFNEAKIHFTTVLLKNFSKHQSKVLTLTRVFDVFYACPFPWQIHFLSVVDLNLILMWVEIKNARKRRRRGWRMLRRLSPRRSNRSPRRMSQSSRRTSATPRGLTRTPPKDPEEEKDGGIGKDFDMKFDFEIL